MYRVETEREKKYKTERHDEDIRYEIIRFRNTMDREYKYSGKNGENEAEGKEDYRHFSEIRRRVLKNCNYRNTVEEQFKYESAEEYRKAHTADNFLVTCNHPTLAYYALKLDTDKNIYSGCVYGTMVKGLGGNKSNIRIPVINMRTMQLKLCTHEDIAAITEIVDREQRNFIIFDGRNSDAVGIQQREWNNCFPLITRDITVYNNEFIRVFTGGLDATIWVLSKSIYCNEKRIATVEGISYNRDRLWIGEFRPLKMVYQPLPGLLVVQIGIEVRHKGLDRKHTDTLLLTILFNMLTGEVMYLTLNKKEYKLEAEVLDTDNTRIIEMLKSNVLFNAVVTGRIHETD